MNSIDQILDIISSQTGKLKNTEIAIELGVSPQVLSTWKKRGTIPYEVLFEYAEKNGISLDHLFLGKEGIKLEIESIDKDLLSMINYEFEIIYKYQVEKNEAAKWLWMRSIGSEYIEKIPRPTDDELNDVFADIFEKNYKFAKMFNAYVDVTNEADKKERLQKIKHLALVNSTFIKDVYSQGSGRFGEFRSIGEFLKEIKKDIELEKNIK